MLRFTFLLALWLGMQGALPAQVPDSVFIEGSKALRKKRLPWFVGLTAASYGATLYGLSKVWYSEKSSGEFNFFADQAEWKQVDKAGHIYGTYQLGHVAARGLRWSGVGEKKAYIYGALMGWGFTMPIEIMDGYSQEYGASWSDLVANTVGAGLLVGQYLLWEEIRLHPKFSFHPTDYASIRPELLGSSWAEQLIKDYNGQTYWLSVDIYSFLREESAFPKWLNVALGYGAHDMVYADDPTNTLMGYDAYREYYLGIDIDLTHIRTRKKWVRTLIFALNTIRLPAPALSYNRKKGFRFHPLYF